MATPVDSHLRTTRVVAKLHTPMVVTGVEELVAGLEQMYGKGLVIITDGPLWEQDWMIIARQEETGEHDIPPML